MSHLADIWESIADAIGEAPALVHGSTTRSWTQFEDRAARLASALASLGVRPGTVVAVDLLNCSEYLEVYFAALKLRATPANINYRYGGHELRQLLELSGARVLIAHASLLDRVAPALEHAGTVRATIVVDDLDADDLEGGERTGDWLDYGAMLSAHEPAPRIDRDESDIFVSFTGGTTGLPKAVAYRVGRSTESAVRARELIVGERFPAEEDPVPGALRLQNEGRGAVTIPASPLMHSTGLQFASFPALVAGGCVVTDGSPSFEPTRVLSETQRHRATSIAIVGDAFARPLLNALDDQAARAEPYDCASLRCIASAGLTWSADVKRGLLRHIPHVALVEACGSTEGAYYGTEITRHGDEIVTGRFTAGPGVKIVDDDLGEVAPGMIGRIAAPTVAAGYLGDTEATERNFTEFDGLRYTIPGDLGTIDGDGTLVLIGRGTSVINRGGEKVFPEEVEQILLEHPAVDDALVFGLADARLGQSVAAIVGVRVDAAPTADELRDLMSTRLASYKVPRAILFAEVPRFPNGKPDYAAATELAMAAARQRSTS